MTTLLHRPFLFPILLSLLFSPLPGVSASAPGPAYGNAYVLELEGRPVATLRSFSGGAMTADVAVTETPFCCFQEKHLRFVRPEDLVLEVAGELGSGLVGWIQDNLSGDRAGRDGSIVILDRDYREVRRLNFALALIAEINLPPFGAASSSAFSLTLRITPEQSQFAKGSNRPYVVPVSKQKSWLARNFRLDIPGINTARVAAVDAITIKRKIVSPDPKEFRGYGSSVGSFEISPLAVTVAESGAGGFEAWYQDFVLKGNADDTRELEGTLTVLSSDLRSSLLTVSLHHLGIYRFTYEYGSSTAGATARAVAYIEGVSMAGGSQ